MEIKKENIEISSTQRFDILDVTELIQDVIEKNKVDNGIAIITTHHTSAALLTNENDRRIAKIFNVEMKEGLFEDIARAFLKLFPPDLKYSHNRIHHVTHSQPNASAHLISVVLNRPVIVNIKNGELGLSKFESIIFIEADGPRKRDVEVTMIY